MYYSLTNHQKIECFRATPVFLACDSVVNNSNRAWLGALCATGRGSRAKKAPSCVQCLLLPLSPLLAVASLPPACDRRQRGFSQAASKVTLPKGQKSQLQIPDGLKSHRASQVHRSKRMLQVPLPRGASGERPQRSRAIFNPPQNPFQTLSAGA